MQWTCGTRGATMRVTSLLVLASLVASASCASPQRSPQTTATRVDSGAVRTVTPSGTPIGLGATMTHFTVPSALGATLDSRVALASGPLVLIFYRGDW